MVLIIKAESDYIRQHSSGTHIAITNKKKDSKRKKYYCEESAVAMRLLREYRGKQND